MKDYILEVCVDSVESALAAVTGGATRLELCGNLLIGGTTPSVWLLKEIRKYTQVPVHVLIRPRFGDFCYSEYEHTIIKEEIKMFEANGAEGIVIGTLCKDGTLDRKRMQELLEVKGNMSATLHRAFDVCRNPYESLEEAIALGFDCILTSGQGNTCIQGIPILQKLVEQSKGRICIQIGSGVNAQVIPELFHTTRAKAYHMSGKITVESAMEYRKEDVNMGLPIIGEYEIVRTSKKQIVEAKRILEEL